VPRTSIFSTGALDTEAGKILGSGAGAPRQQLTSQSGAVILSRLCQVDADAESARHIPPRREPEPVRTPYSRP